MASPGFAEAVKQFTEYLTGYQQSSRRTIRAYVADLKMFARFAASLDGGEAGPGDITRENIMQYAMTLRGAATSKRRRLATLSSFFGFLQAVGIVMQNPATRIPLPRVPQGPAKTIPVAVYNHLLVHGKVPWQRCALVLLYETGMRCCELVAIRVPDIDVVVSEVLVHGKGQKDRTIPLNDRAMAEVAAYLIVRGHPDTDVLLVGIFGKAIRDHSIHRAMRRLNRAAGLNGDHVTAHMFRHTFATRLIQGGVDIATVQELLGHANIQTTGRYLHTDMRTKRAAVDMLAAA